MTRSIMTRSLCYECREPVQYIYADFTTGEQKLEPCGHRAAIYCEPIGPFGVVPEQ